MKKLLSMLFLSLSVATVSAQEQPDTLYISLYNGSVAKFSVDEICSMGFTAVGGPEFPEPDGSTALNIANPGKSAHSLLLKAGTQCTDTLGRANITAEEYNEIKEFTQNLVSGCTTQKAIYNKCFNWITSNIKYPQTAEYPDESGFTGPVSNDPYPVFKTKYGVCQGYANLLFIMLHSQEVPAMVVYGTLSYYGGHAWNIVNCDGTWYVSDPTNGGKYTMSDYDSYKDWLILDSMDVVLFKDAECWYGFHEKRLNVSKIVSNKSTLVIPYSVEGFKITSLNPVEELPSCVRELYLGENIESLGENSMGLLTYAPHLEYVHVDPDNKELKSHAGVVYRAWSNTPLYIPSAMKRLELLPLEKYEKNTIYRIDGIEEIVFPEGTKSIENWAVEYCPNLKIAYVPEATTVAESAFQSVHEDFKIVRY